MSVGKPMGTLATMIANVPTRTEFKSAQHKFVTYIPGHGIPPGEGATQAAAVAKAKSILNSYMHRAFVHDK